MSTDKGCALLPWFSFINARIDELRCCWPCESTYNIRAHRLQWLKIWEETANRLRSSRSLILPAGSLTIWGRTRPKSHSTELRSGAQSRGK